MYSQRRYGGSGARMSQNPDSRYSGRRDSKGTSNNSGPKVGVSSPSQKPELQRTSESRVQTEKQPKYPVNKSDSLINEAAGPEGYQFEECYVEADVVGYDETGGDDNCNQQEALAREPLTNQQKEGTFQKLEQRDEYGYSGREQKQNFNSSKPQGQQTPSMDTRKSYEELIVGSDEQRGLGNEQLMSKDTGNDESFGFISVGGVKYVKVESLIGSNEKIHSGRSRLFIANLAKEVTERDLKELFSKFGETNEIYVNKEKLFGFVRLDYKVNAEMARNALDGYFYKGRHLKVKYAAHQSAIEIHGIDRFTSNESLEAAFVQFGAVERARVVCDERGKSKGYAVVEFAYKKAAQNALRRINDGLFVLGRIPKPVYAKPLSQTDDEGVHEADLERVPGIAKDREYQARFIPSNTPEYPMALKWRELQDREQAQKESLEQQMEDDRQKLEIDIEAAMHEHEAEFIRQELLQRQAALEEEIRRYDEMRNRESMLIRQGHQNIYKDSRMNDSRQDDFIRKQQQEMHRRQGNDDVVRGMQNAASNMGINPATALAMAASGNPAATAAAANILQAIKVGDNIGGNGPGMQRMGGPMGGPMGVPPLGMRPGGMPQPPRPLLDGMQGPSRGNFVPGSRRPGSRDNTPNNKRLRR